MNKLILLLGAPNDEKGRLSRMALDRAEAAWNLYEANKNVKILCTGGFGSHFNTTGLPHAQYVKQFLIEKGVNKEDFQDFVLSSNTAEDFRKVKPILEKQQPGLLIVISSDFHIPRVKILYDLIVGYSKVVFMPAVSHLPAEQLTACIQHEKKAIAELEANNFVLY